MTKKTTPPKTNPNGKVPSGIVIHRPDRTDFGSNSMPKFVNPPPPPPSPKNDE